jgi:NAD(P)-dependent dehydrogenase (short-subunit alcohol dehydrogenase family)
MGPKSVVLITGCSTGIGRAQAGALLDVTDEASTG